MGMLDTLIHGKTAFLAGVAKKIVVKEVILGKESGFKNKQKVEFDIPRTVDYRADVNDIAEYLLRLMNDRKLRESLGENGRKHVVSQFDYRIVAQKFIKIIQERLGIN